MNKILFLVLLIAAVVMGADSTESLNEMFRRKPRRTAANFLIDSIETTGAMKQPETFMYHDDSSGREVWKMTSTPNKKSGIYDIGLSPWNADGSIMSWYSTDTTSQFAWGGGYNIWHLSRTDGRLKKPVVGGGARVAAHRDFMGWNPQIPNTYYMFGWASTGLVTSKNILYKNTVSDSAVTRSELLTFSDSHGEDLMINKLMSMDGRGIYACTFSEDWWFPATVYPDDSVKIDDSVGHAAYRGYENYGNFEDTANGLHDQYPSGSKDWVFTLPTMSDNGIEESTWWRIKTTGSRDGGCQCEHDTFPVTSSMLPYDFGSCWVECNGSNDGANNPFGSPYWSHFCPDPWGRYALGSMGYGSYDGAAIWDVQNHDSVVLWDINSNHHAWNSFSDISVTTSLTDTGYMFFHDRTAEPYTTYYRAPVTGLFLCRTYGRYNGSTSDYDVIPRPGISPDGTKASWHSVFLNPGLTSQDLFWTKIRSPKAPDSLTATDGATITISYLPPKYTERGWPYYRTDYDTTDYGWPELDENGNEIGKPCYAREVYRYHLWRSANGTTGWALIQSDTAIYAYDYKENDQWFFYHPIDADSNEICDTNKLEFSIAKANGTYYYAITTEEHSGLESDTLSEILRIDVVGGSIDTSYISDANGPGGYWTTKPSSPSVTSVLDGGQADHYRINWTEPEDDKIRYYNIYYSPTAVPEATEQYRIASVPKQTATFYDWLADSTADTVYYKVTSVDRYGNESDGTHYFHESANFTVLDTMYDVSGDNVSWIVQSNNWKHNIYLESAADTSGAITAIDSSIGLAAGTKDTLTSTIGTTYLRITGRSTK